MGRFWKDVNTVIREADVLLLIIDARFVPETKNREIVDKARVQGKPLIYVFNKTDLIDIRTLSDAKKRMKPYALVSTKKKRGISELKKRIAMEGKEFLKKKGRIVVGVLGYPNVGKSSLINMMKGRRSTSVSPLSGRTRCKQTVRTSQSLYFIDTPGVTPYLEKDKLKFMFTNVTDYTKVKDPETMVERLMNRFPGRIEKFYGVPVQEDKQATIEEIALNKHVIKKGNLPDTKRMSVTIIMNWQKGKIK
jgi:ribosome biogenesis GTPase A